MAAAVPRINAQLPIAAVEMELIDYNKGLEQAFWLAIGLSAVPLLSSLVVGLISSVLQAATQIQEQTLSFVPKLTAVAAVLWLCGPWGARRLAEFLSDILLRLPQLTDHW